MQQLTGACVIDHYSAASSSPLYDVDVLKWSDALSPDLIALDRLPDLAWTTDIAGTVTARAAEATGLAAGTPVITGTIDAAAEAISVGVQAPGDMMLMYGSTIFIILVAPTRVRDPRLWYAPWLYPGPARLDGGARHQRDAHALVPRAVRARVGGGRRLRSNWPPRPKPRRLAPKASSCSRTSRASARRFTIRTPRACCSDSI